MYIAGGETFIAKKKDKEKAEYIRSEDIDDIKAEVIEAAIIEARKEVIKLLGGVISGMNVGQPVIMQANELEYVDESQKSDAAESANASNGSTGAKPVRNPEREKPKWEDTITNRMLHWSYTPEQKEEVKKALAAGVPKATILTYFYAEVTVEKMSSYRNKH